MLSESPRWGHVRLNLSNPLHSRRRPDEWKWSKAFWCWLNRISSWNPTSFISDISTEYIYVISHSLLHQCHWRPATGNESHHISLIKDHKGADGNDSGLKSSPKASACRRVWSVSEGKPALRECSARISLCVIVRTCGLLCIKPTELNLNLKLKFNLINKFIWLRVICLVSMPPNIHQQEGFACLQSNETGN